MPARDTVAVGGESVQLHENDAHFAAMRAQDRVSLDDVGPQQFRFAELASGGGKGGALMQATRNRRLIVKQLAPDNHATLSTVAADLVRHCTSTPSMLMRIYYHFYRPADKTFYVVVKNLLPEEFATRDEACSLFDLKGSCDDKMMLDCGEKVLQVVRLRAEPRTWCADTRRARAHTHARARTHTCTHSLTRTHTRVTHARVARPRVGRATGAQALLQPSLAYGRGCRSAAVRGSRSQNVHAGQDPCLERDIRAIARGQAARDEPGNR